MVGAIIGDIIGLKVIRRFNDVGIGEFTDNTVMTAAVAAALTRTKNPEKLGNVLKDIMSDYSCRYPNVVHIGFGSGFTACVSPCGYIAESLEEALALAEVSAGFFRNDPESIKAAKTVAAVIYMAKNGIRKSGIKKYIEDNYYKLDFNLDEDSGKPFHEIVPQAIQCFLIGYSFEDIIRNAISIGGDSNTIACIAGSIAEAYYGVSDEIKKAYLPECFADVMDKFYSFAADNSSVERIKKKMKECIEKHNEKNPRGVKGADCTCRWIDTKCVHVGKIVIEQVEEWGCFKCECGWFCYFDYSQNGEEIDCITGPYEEASVPKALCCQLGIDEKTSGLEGFTKAEEAAYCHPWQDYINGFCSQCKSCEYKSWCMERGWG